VGELISLKGTRHYDKNGTYRISRDVTASSRILTIICTDIACNVQDCVGTAGTENCADEVEGVAIGVVST
jgi:hypothetical protein